MTRVGLVSAAVLAGTVLAGAAVLFVSPDARAAGILQSPAYSVEVSDVAAKVGEHAIMRITLRPHDGYRILAHYTNRVSRFSSLDNSVAFDDPVVAGTMQDNTLVFAVGVTPTKPGRHPINGVFRVGYIDNDGLSMVSVPLISNVIGSQ